VEEVELNILVAGPIQQSLSCAQLSGSILVESFTPSKYWVLHSVEILGLGDRQHDDFARALRRSMEPSAQ
jgi:hypothetical protein